VLKLVPNPDPIGVPAVIVVDPAPLVVVVVAVVVVVVVVVVVAVVVVVVVVVVVDDDDDEKEGEEDEEEDEPMEDTGDEASSDEGIDGQAAAPELLGELHSGIPELGLELGLEAKENGSGAKLLTQGDDSDEEEEEEEAEE